MSKDKGEPRPAGGTLLGKARQAFERYDFAKVEELTSRAAEAPSAGNAELLLLRVRALARRGRVRTALETAEAVLESPSLPPELAGAFRVEQARLLYDAARHDSALRAVEQGQAVARPEERRQLEILRALAISGRGDQETAREILESIAQNARAENRPDVEAEVLSRLMLVAHRSANHARLEELGHRVIEIAGAKDSLALARAHRYLAVACGVQQRYAEALEHHRRAMQVYRCLNDPLGLARERLSLGLHYIDMGEPELAEVCLAEGLKMAENCEDVTLRSTAFARLGTFALSQGKAEQALEYFQRDLGLTRDTEAVHNRAFPLRNIGRALTLLGRFQEAERHFAESREAFETVGDRVNVAMTLFDWAVAKSATAAGAAEALALVQEGRAMLESLGRRHMLPHADIAESHAHFRLGNIERAEDLFDRAAAAWLEKQNLARVAESAIRFGNLLAEAGDLGRAIRVLQKGLDAAIRGSYGELVRRFVARITELDREALVLQPIRSNPDFALSDAETAAPARAEEIVGISPAIETVRELVRRVAPTDVPVLVTGESGVGKELVARAIHGSSPRHARPLVVVNCGAIPEGLVEAELFGHRKGAFTGAVRDAPGKLVLADGGTVFLDEVGDLPLSAQVKILRFLQSGEVHTVGDAAASARRVNVRVIAATNRDLARMAADGRFRSDLLFRLNTFPIRVPPLRERPEDIRPIAEHLMRTDPVFRSRGIVKVSRAAMDALRRHTWPGNVRELHGALVYAAVLARGDTLQSHVLPESVTGCVEPASPATFPTLQEVQREHVARALELAGGNQSRAAELLGVHRNTLRNWMLFGRDRPEPRRPESRSASPPKGRSPSPTRSKP